MQLQKELIDELNHTPATTAMVARCQRAKRFEETGEFELAREALGRFWNRVGDRPRTADLPEAAKAELLLRSGTLTGWIGSAKQISGSQEIAKDLISESANIFEQLGQKEKAAEARIDLGICYWREGAFDEARVTLRHALDTLGNLESEQRLRALLNSAVVERSATRYGEALKIHHEAAPMFAKSTNGALNGKFHSEYATVLKNLGLAENREDYIDRALLEFAAASVHFEQVGHKRFQASVENNQGFLFANLGKFREAEEHLDRARHLFQSLKDQGGVARVDETLAQTFLLEGRNKEAERLARTAVQVFEQGGEQAALAEALTTQGKALARLNQPHKAVVKLRQAMDVARTVGDPDSGGIAALTMIEELGSQLQFDSLQEYYTAAESLLSSSQHYRIAFRLGECARLVIAASDLSRTSQSPREDLSVSANTSVQPEQNVEAPDSTASFSLEAEVHRYEGNLIRQALQTAGGSVTRAARLLGITHQGLAFILNGRHSDLLSVRTPVKRRKRSIIRYH
jgi:tetratricopeptide (TPR) repeat protein